MEDVRGRFLDVVKSFASVAPSLSKYDSRAVARLVEVSKAHLRARAERFVAECGDRALLLSYSGDGTPIKTIEQHTIRVDGDAATRKGGAAMEFYLHRLFLKFSAGTEQRVCVLFDDPWPMTHGKGAWCSFAIGHALFPTARRLGHRGLVIQHYCFDRALYSACLRIFEQYHALQYRGNRLVETSGKSLAYLSLLEWVVGTACVMHDVDSCFRRAMRIHTTKDVLSNLFITVESVRNAFDLVSKEVPLWVPSVLHFAPRSWTHDDLFVWWVSLRVEPDWAHRMARLHLLYRDGKLYLDEDVHRDNQLYEVAACLLHLFRFKKFSTGRFQRIGEVCQTLVKCYSVGFSDLLRSLRAREENSEYYIHGVDRFDNATKRYCAVAAFSCNLPSSVHGQLLEDDRIAKRVGEIEVEVSEEVVQRIEEATHIQN